MATDLDNQNNDFLRFWEKLMKIFSVHKLIHIEYPWKIYDYEREKFLYPDLYEFIDKAILKFDKNEEKLEIEFMGEENIIWIDYTDDEILKKFLNYLFEHALLFKLNIFSYKIRDITLLKDLIEENIELIEITLFFKEKLNKKQVKDLQDLGKAYNFKILKEISENGENEDFFIFFENLIEFNNDIIEFIDEVEKKLNLNDIRLFLTKDFSKIMSIDDSYERVYQFKITLLGSDPLIWRRIQVPENYTFREFHVAIQNAMGWNDEHLHEFHLKNPKTGFKTNILYGNCYEDLEGYMNDEMINFIKNPKKTLEEYKKIMELKEKGKLKVIWKEILQNFYSDINLKNVFHYPYYEELSDAIKERISFNEYIKHYAIYLVIKNKNLKEYYLDKDVKISDFFTNKNKKCKYIYDLGDYWVHNIKFEGIYPRKNKERYPICIDGERACPIENFGYIHEYHDYFDILQDHNHPEYKQALDWLENICPPHWIGKAEKYNPEYFNKDDVIFLDPKRYIKRVTSRGPKWLNEF
ncbi:MAG: plasmid pRiA4b ORF-3 family protein [Promethearchaeota archaeon]